jgi:hypothetical protein
LLTFVPGMATIPPLDRDESRFTQATKQMIETGDFIEIRFQDEARNKKPIGIYWMQAITAGWLSDEPFNSIWAYRIPSVLGGILTVLFVFGLGAKLFDEETGLIGAGLMASSLLLIGETHIAKTDAVLLALVTATQLMVAHFFVAARQGAPQPRLRDSVLLGLAFGLGVLVKGPMILFFVGLTVIARHRHLDQRSLVGRHRPRHQGRLFLRGDRTRLPRQGGWRPRKSLGTTRLLPRDTSGRLLAGMVVRGARHSVRSCASQRRRRPLPTRLARPRLDHP